VTTENVRTRKFRVLWGTKATRKVLASCGGLARGAEVSGNSGSRSNKRMHGDRAIARENQSSTRIAVIFVAKALATHPPGA